MGPERDGIRVLQAVAVLSTSCVTFAGSVACVSSVSEGFQSKHKTEEQGF